MSEKKKQRETCIMIKDTSQRGVATCFRYGGTFDYFLVYYKFTAEPVLKEFRSIFGRVMGKS